MTGKKIKVLVVDDSAVARDLLAYIIQSDPQLEVIGFANDGEQALEFLKHHQPDIITMDVMMPKMDGFETTRKIIQHYPIPIVIVTNSYKKNDTKKMFTAIDAGALAILEKPKGPQDSNFSQMAQEIVGCLKLMSEIKVITRKPYFQTVRHPAQPKAQAKRIEEKALEALCHIELIVIGTSLGGPQALESILSQLPRNFPIPIFIVQHIASGFVQGLVEWLSGITPLKVRLARHDDKGEPGTVLVAPDKFHMEIEKNLTVKLVAGPPETGLIPSVARLFRSTAANYGNKAAGIILTGMGKDGAEDLLKMKLAGAVTVAQNEESCVIFGMPGEAIRLGAAHHILHIDEIPLFMIRLTEEKNR